MKRLLVVIGVALGLAAAAGACEMSFRLIDASGKARAVAPGREIALVRGETYRLEVSFTEDHGTCKVKAEATEFFVEGQPWKSSAGSLPLVLLKEPQWRDTSSRSHVTELVFRPAAAGTWELEVVRDCSKGGYDESLRFKVI